MSNGVQYQCCFCGNGIAVIGPDPGMLSYAPRNYPEPVESAQQMYCHAACLAAALHKSVTLYALDLMPDEN